MATTNISLDVKTDSFNLIWMLYFHLFFYKTPCYLIQRCHVLELDFALFECQPETRYPCLKFVTSICRRHVVSHLVPV